MARELIVIAPSDAGSPLVGGTEIVAQILPTNSRARWGPPACAALLAATPLFARLPAERSREVARLSQPRRVRCGAFLFREGESADALYFVAEGWVKVFRGTEEGQEVILRVLGPGELFGGGGGWGGASYPASASAVEATVAPACRD